MELREVFTEQFSSSTSCYSGAKLLEIRHQEEDPIVSLCTETHLLRVKIVNNATPTTTTADEDYSPPIQIEEETSLPRDSSSVIGVGFSTDSSDLVAVALVDLAVLDGYNDDDEVPQPLYQPTTNASSSATDNMSVVSASPSEASSSSTRGGLQYHRRSSSGTASTTTAQTSSSTTTLSGNTSSVPSQPPRHHTRSKSTEMGSVSNSSTIDQNASFPSIAITTPLKTDDNINSSNTENSSSSSKPKARLLLRTSLTETYFALLDFRPLSPCVCQFGDDFRGVWVGNAEEAAVHLFVANRTTGRLEPYALSEKDNLFAVTTPVLGLAFYSYIMTTSTRDEQRYILGMACQDGTLHLRMWGGSEEGVPITLHNVISRHEVMVDGPILPLQFQHQSSSNSSFSFLRIIVGSLCGYVCQVRYNESQSVWEDPTMVVEGLYNEMTDLEDSVVTVHAFDNYIAMGTHFGRCLLYSQSGESQWSDSLVWECTLPYSIHGIVGHIRMDSKSNKVMQLIVTTRRTFHLFECIQPVVASCPKTPEYSVSLAQQRLLALLQLSAKKQKDSRSDDATTTHKEENDSHTRHTLIDNHNRSSLDQNIMDTTTTNNEEIDNRTEDEQNVQKKSNDDRRST